MPSVRNWILPPPPDPDDRITDLKIKAMRLEERADYAEKEAQLRKRINTAEKRISAVRPSFGLANLGGVKVIVALLAIVVIILVVVSAC